MSIVADLIRAGVDAELVARVADEIAKARADGAADAVAAPSRTARQDRNQRYYEARKERLKTSDERLNKTIKTVSDAESQSAEMRTHVGAPAGQITTKTTTKDNSKTHPSDGQKPKRSSARTRIASDAQPNERDRAAAGEAGMDEPTFRHEWAKFRERHIAQGSTMADWSAAWRTWILNWQSFGSQPIGKVHNGFAPRAGPASRPAKPSVVAAWTEDIFTDEQRHNASAETRRPALAYRG